MAADLDVDGIMKALSDPSATKNLGGIMDALKEVNKCLQEAQKTVDFLDRCGVKELLVRAAGKKLDIDVDTPLKSEKRGNGIDPQSKTHAQIFQKLNTMSEKQVVDMFTEPEETEANTDE